MIKVKTAKEVLSIIILLGLTGINDELIKDVIWIKYLALMQLIPLIMLTVKDFINIDMIHFLKKNILTLILVLYILLTNIWSIDKNITYIRTCYLLIIFVLSLCLQFNEINEIIRIIYKYMLVILLLNLFVILFKKPIALASDVRYLNVYKGIFSHRNTLGFYGLVGFMFSILNIKNDFKKKNKLQLSVIVLLYVILILISKSMTSFLMMLLYLFYLIILKNIENKWLKISLVTLPFIFNALYFLLFSNLSTFRVFMENVLKRDITFSGRLYIWKTIKEVFYYENLFNKLFGFGYSAFWDSINSRKSIIINLVGFEFHGAHNGYLDVLLSFGYVGLTIVLTWLVVYILSMIKNNDLLICVVVILLFYNFYESNLTSNIVLFILFTFNLNFNSAKKLGKYKKI